ncbi:hypothetical protein [Pseudodesulfovibrio piezophilus]|uniref:Uncharacterized protein n=1 Tax=Pseudodesulfovibrio piezophilus (strain DSM 21447 / JCM 15486 / C1TLV30) TaxID=1322246 RepID=M1WU46_PSEP2|nr:hypothetical protein [Pseudodesulfovibrio piezophilus]CCH50227.1 conserved protein of unknown function [Pseudodesulfovibrio piezophilus C1TLV30]
MALEIYEDSLYGQVLPLDWDDDAVSGIVILVDGEEEFLVENNENGEQLIDHIDRWVTAQGIITESEDEYRIKIRNYKLEDEMDYQSDDDW